MSQRALEIVMEKTEELLNARTCCKDVKVAATFWLAFFGTGNEDEMVREYMEALEENIVTVEELEALAESEAGEEIFGYKAPKVAAHARELKAAGAKYCDCPACAAAEAILSQKEALLK